MIYDSTPDLDFDKNLKKIRKEISREPGKIIFDPSTYKSVETFLTMEANKLQAEELEQFAIIATDLRAQFTRKANDLVRSEASLSNMDNSEEQKSVPKLYRGCAKRKSKSDKIYKTLGFEAREDYGKHKKLNKCKLNAA